MCDCVKFRTVDSISPSVAFLSQDMLALRAFECKVLCGLARGQYRDRVLNAKYDSYEGINRLEAPVILGVSFL